jgi:hypothetical protein
MKPRDFIPEYIYNEASMRHQYTEPRKKIKSGIKAAPCSLGLSATSQHYFSLTNSTLLSEETSTSHQPTEQAAILDRRKLGAVQHKADTIIQFI